MKNQRLVVLAIAIAFGILTGCSGRSGVHESLTTAKLGEGIMQAVNLNEMQRGDSEKLRRIYHIEASDVDDFVLYTAVSNVKADELAIIKVKDASEIEAVMDQIRQRVEAQTVKFKDYRPEEYALIEKHVLKSKDPFILFAVSKDIGRIERAFDDALK
ncbi:hypothetical protein D3C74_46810 [compost metagenome]